MQVNVLENLLEDNKNNFNNYNNGSPIKGNKQN